MGTRRDRTGTNTREWVSALAIAGLIAGGSARPALADEPANSGTGGTPAASGPGGLEEIVITAQKRSERLIDVPMSVTAITGGGAHGLPWRGHSGCVPVPLPSVGARGWGHDGHHPGRTGRRAGGITTAALGGYTVPRGRTNRFGSYSETNSRFTALCGRAKYLLSDRGRAPAGLAPPQKSSVHCASQHRRESRGTHSRTLQLSRAPARPIG
jgi:hypothetical protein